MKKTTVLKKNPDIVARVINKETILIPIYKTSEEINCIYSLNDIASRLWEMIDGRMTISEIKKKVLDEFEVTSEEADKELRVFLNDLNEIKAIKRVNND